MARTDGIGATKARLAAPPPALILGAICLGLHLVFNRGYGAFRDELYFIVCGLHPDFGYVDQPPLAPLIAGLSYRLFGLALTPLRLAPALAMSATVALAAEFARALGGGRFAQWTAGLATLLAPVLLVDGLLMSTDFLQPLSWLGLSWCILKLAQSRDQRWWIAFGAIVGVSWESKYLIGFYVVGLAPGVLLTPLRRSFGSSPWIYAGATLALAIAAPNLIWQATHGWPFLQLASAGAAGKNLAMSPLGFLGQQALFLGPPAAPIWLAGLWRLATGRERPELRAIAIAWAVAFALFLVSHGKAYYLTPMGPTLFGAGAVAIESWLSRRPARVLRAPLLAVLALGGTVTMPLSLPILAPERLIAYQGAIGLGPSVGATERGSQGPLPQYFADMFGWREMAEAVSEVYRSLPEADRAKAVFFGRNYGEAAAVELYGPAFGGPPVISAHNQYYLWGPRGYDGSVVITVGGDRSALARIFADVEEKGRIATPYAVPAENEIPIFVLRSPRKPLDELWPRLKHFE